MRDPLQDRLRKLRAWGPGDRGLLAVATGTLPLIALGLRVVGFERLFGQLERWSGQPAPAALESDATRAWRTRQLVDAAPRHGLYRGNCLSRSLTLWWLLRRQRIGSELRIGVRRGDRGIAAHARVESAGRVLNDTPDVATRHVSFDQPIVPRRLTLR